MAYASGLIDVQVECMEYRTPREKNMSTRTFMSQKGPRIEDELQTEVIPANIFLSQVLHSTNEECEGGSGHYDKEEERTRNTGIRKTEYGWKNYPWQSVSHLAPNSGAGVNRLTAIQRT